MRGTLAAYCERWVFASAPVAFTLPILAVAAMSLAGIVFEHMTGAQWYASPYVALVAVMADRVCVRAGLLSAVLAMLSFNYFFAGNSNWAFDPVTLPEATVYVSMIAVALFVAPRQPPAGTPKVYDSERNLPFTANETNHNNAKRSLHGTGRRYWSVQASGNWAADCHLGAEYARIFVERTKAIEARPMLCWIVRDMIAEGRFSGVEAGFIQTLGRLYLADGPTEAPRQLSRE